jgi:Flp pilus assembly protein TadD
MNRPRRRAAAAAESAAHILAEAVERHQTGKLAEAEALYRKALKLSPNEAEIHYNRGVALLQMGQAREATASWRRALARRPDYLKALANLGSALGELDQVPEAARILAAAVVCGPDQAEPYNNLAIILRASGRWDDALAVCKRALAVRPDYADAHNSAGIIFYEMGRLTESVASYRLALRDTPQFAKAHFNLGMALLARGELAEGWREHEWRWQGGARHLKPRGFAQPPWRGERLDGRTLLLHAEQGFGDTLQFARFAPVAAGLGARVILEVQPALARLCRTLAGVTEVIPAGEDLPYFDRHLPLMSVPNVLGTTFDSLPAATPYLHADPAEVERWRRRLADLPGCKVGLVWSGDPRTHDLRANLIDRRRSIGLAALAPLLALPGISYVSLQMGGAKAQMRDIAPRLRPRDVTDAIGDFGDSAAAMSELDLVITVDTAAAHLAGALGRPVWILSRFDACWRWLRNRDDSPWYPSARLFRQRTPGDWGDVVSRVAEALAGAPSEENRTAG